MFSVVDSKYKSSLAHTSKKVSSHEASNMCLIECLSDVGKRINKYETIDKAAGPILVSAAVMAAICWLSQVTAVS